MEPDLVLQRVTDGFDAPGLGIVMDLASWHHSGRLSLSGVSDDLIADLSRLRCPALLVSSHDDAVVPARHSLSPRHLPLARTRAVIHRGFGHCDLLAGMEAPHRVWPDVFRWLGTGFVTG
jgi:poly(3-hydroxyalkanoate) synthetase